MKKNLTNLIRLTVFAVLQLTLLQGVVAQGNEADNFLFTVTTSSGTQIFKQEACGFGYSQFGASVQAELCADIVWAYDDVAGDSLCCDTITGQDLSGKFALMRRGVCNFSLKALHAQAAGAIGALIANHFDTPTDDGCSIIGMAAGTYAGFVTIPCIFMCRDMGTTIDDALKAGETVNGCFLLPRTGRPMTANHNLTPVSQVDTMYYMGMEFINRDQNAIDNLVITVDITGPNGYTHNFSTPINASLAPGLDTFLYVDNYMPPAVIGQYDVTFTNNVYTEPRDVQHRSFWITPYSFGVDNADLRLDGGADRNDLFLNGGFIYQIGGLCLTGADGGNATHVTFGIANIDSVFVADNSVNIFVYDADSDGDGTINLTADWTDLASDIVGSGVYTMQGNETEGVLLDVPIEDYLNPGQPVHLNAYHPYYVALLYDGTFEGSGRNCAFSNTSWSDYLNFPTTPMFLGQFYNGGWGDRTVIHRLQLEGYVPGTAVKPDLLSANKFAVTPNPGNSYVNLNLDLAGVNDKVGVTIVSAQGKLIRQQTLSNFQSGVVRFDVADVPSGHYLMLIHTKEGHAVAKVAICH